MSKKKIAFAVNQTKAGAVEAESFLRTAAGEIGLEVVDIARPAKSYWVRVPILTGSPSFSRRNDTEYIGFP